MRSATALERQTEQRRRRSRCCTLRPDDWVHRHNERIEAVQGNRNPYIDHPELVCRAWGLGCP